ncbi:MAG: HAMP domain-containing histidine kinase [Campylobacterales bacterium]|nr:HAMP domain-containing histidine kinase [Campylobacterales bacterium]
MSQKKLTILFLIIFLALFGGIFTLNYTYKEKLIQKELSDVINELRINFKVTNYDNTIDGKYLRSYDIGYSAESMEETINEVNMIKFHFLVKKQVFNPLVWKRKNDKLQFVQSIENRKYMSIFAKNSYDDKSNFETNIIQPNRTLIEKNMEESKNFALYDKIGDEVGVTAFVPIKNIKDKKTIAYIVSYTKNAFLAEISIIYMMINFFGFVIIALVLIYIYREISLRHYLEKEVARQIKTNEKQKEILFKQAKKASLGELISIIAHQLKQPLNAISLSIDEIQESYEYKEMTEESLAATSKIVHERIRFMSSSIDELRNFFRSDKIPKPFSLNKAIDKSLSLISSQISKRGIALKVEVKEDIMINGFENELEQVVMNIVNNAKDVLVEKSPEKPMIKIDTMVEDDKAILTITDNGGGIPEDIIEKIFDLDFTTKGEQGTGIGLNLAKMIIEGSMGGKISVRNSQERAVFVIELPL